MMLNPSTTYLAVDCLINILVGIIGFIQNVAQLLLLKRKKEWRIFDYTLVSLGASGFIAALLFLLNGVILLLMAVDVDLGLSLAAYKCKHHAKFCFALNCSFLHVLFIAAQRLVAVIFPLKAILIMTKTRCFALLVFIWVVSILFDSWSTWKFVGVPLNSLPAILFTYVSVTTGFLLLLAYIFICHRLAKRSNIINTQSSTNQHRRVVSYAVAITVLFFISIMPAAVMTFMRYEAKNAYLSEFPYWMLGFNVPLNPIVYFWLSYYKRERWSSLCICCRGKTELMVQKTTGHHPFSMNTVF